MRLRLRDVLPADLQPRVQELTPRQLVALRFASDRELSALVRRVLDDRLTDGKAIKAMVQDWQADHLISRRMTRSCTVSAKMRAKNNITTIAIPISAAIAVSHDGDLDARINCQTALTTLTGNAKPWKRGTNLACFLKDWGLSGMRHSNGRRVSA